MPIILDPRLRAIAEMCGECGTLADIGADHGRLGAYMLKTGSCRRVLFTDISADSLAKARLLIHKNGLSDRCAFSVGDGLKALSETPDVIVIAGMGGTTIAGILTGGADMLGDASLVLEANVGVYELRRAVCAIGYGIADERVARDGRRLYVIMRAERGKAEYSRTELYCGPVLMEKRPAELFDLADFRIRVIEKAIRQAGASDSGSIDDELKGEYEAWKEVVSWRQQESC